MSYVPNDALLDAEGLLPYFDRYVVPRPWQLAQLNRVGRDLIAKAHRIDPFFRATWVARAGPFTAVEGPTVTSQPNFVAHLDIDMAPFTRLEARLATGERVPVPLLQPSQRRDSLDPTGLAAARRYPNGVWLIGDQSAWDQVTHLYWLLQTPWTEVVSGTIGNSFGEPAAIRDVLALRLAAIFAGRMAAMGVPQAREDVPRLHVEADQAERVFLDSVVGAFVPQVIPTTEAF